MSQKLKVLWKKVRTFALVNLFITSSMSIILASLLAKNINDDLKFTMFLAEVLAMTCGIILSTTLFNKDVRIAFLGTAVMFGVMVTTLTASQRALPIETLITWLQMFGVSISFFSLLSIPDLLKKTETEVGAK